MWHDLEAKVGRHRASRSRRLTVFIRLVTNLKLVHNSCYSVLCNNKAAQPAAVLSLGAVCKAPGRKGPGIQAAVGAERRACAGPRGRGQNPLVAGKSDLGGR